MQLAIEHQERRSRRRVQSTARVGERRFGKCATPAHAQDPLCGPHETRLGRQRLVVRRFELKRRVGLRLTSL